MVNESTSLDELVIDFEYRWKGVKNFAFVAQRILNIFKLINLFRFQI